MGTTDKEHGISSSKKTKKTEPKKNKKSSGSSKKMSLTQWINSQLKDKGISVSAAKKDAGKYKSISAAKKAGSLYYTNPKGTVMIAAFASDLDSPPPKKETKKKDMSKEERMALRREASRYVSELQKKGRDVKKSDKPTVTAKTVEVKAVKNKTDMSDDQKRSSGVSGLNLSTIADIKNVLPELRNILSKKDMKALENILSGKVPMSKEAQIREIKKRVKKGLGFNIGGLTKSPMQNGLSRKINPTTGLTMNKGGMTDYRKTGMFYGGGMARRGR
tara:strand:- start:474 stop:1298 length:825 start_codon:yes stop_codon:yes gene_type:complete